MDELMEFRRKERVKTKKEVIGVYFSYFFIISEEALLWNS